MSTTEALCTRNERFRVERLMIRILFFATVAICFFKLSDSFLAHCTVQKAMQIPAQVQADLMTSANIDHSEIPVFGVMLINREDLLLRLLRSIDFPIKRLILFHNSGSDEYTNEKVRDFLEKLQLGQINLDHHYIKEILILYRPVNLGFSAGVNQIVRAAPLSPYWLIVSTDILFKPGALSEISSSMSAIDSSQNKSCIWGHAGTPGNQYASFILTKRAVHTVGYFDENFWPAYAEDCDYTTRLVRSGCPIVFETDPERLAFHEISASIAKDKLLSEIVRRGQNNFDYLIAKWGTDVCNLRIPTPPYLITDVGYVLPFNNSNSSLSTWKIDMNRRVSRGGPKKCIICDSELEL